MDMGMDAELLAPGVQDAEEADLCSKVSRITRYFEKGFCTGAEQEIVNDLLVLQDQWCQATGESEDHVQVARGEKFTSTCGNPPFASSGLTLWTVTITAANGEISIMQSIFSLAARRHQV